jgi:small neutral amino acid transporter SnatA (MarC family)
MAGPPIPLADVALAFFIGMGPIKIVAAFLVVTHDARPEVRRQVAIRTVTAATITAVSLVVAGVVVFRLFHLSAASLVIGGAIVMLGVGLRTVLAPAETYEVVPLHGSHDLYRRAIHPLAVPDLLNPAGIAAAILLSAEVAEVGGFIGGIVIVLAVAALDLAVLLVVARLGDRVHLDVVTILERLFGMLLVAVAIQLLLYGLAQAGVIDFGAVQ